MVNTNTTPAAASRIWTVRGGHDGSGPMLFCVYADTMDQARDSAAQSLARLASERRFTVHALTAGEHTPTGATLERVPLASLIPALDLDLTRHDEDGCPSCVAFGAQFRALT